MNHLTLWGKKMAVYYIVAPRSLVVYQTMQHYNSENCHLCTHYSENLKSYWHKVLHVQSASSKTRFFGTSSNGNAGNMMSLDISTTSVFKLFTTVHHIFMTIVTMLSTPGTVKENKSFYNKISVINSLLCDKRSTLHLQCLNFNLR